MKLTNNDFWKKTSKVFLYSSSVIFKNYKSYLSTLLLPLVVTLLIFAIRTNFFYQPIDPYTFPTLFLIPSISLLIFFSTILLDWRKSVFIKQMQNFGINKYSFILGFTLTTFLCSLMATAFGIIYIYIFSFISFNKENSFNDWAKFVVDGRQVIGLIIAIIFSSLFTSFIAILFTGYLKNIYVIQTVNILLIAFFLVFSDIVITPENSGGIKAICIIGYFDPYRYMSWIDLMFNNKMYTDFYYVYFFIVSLDGYISFNEIWQPIIGSLGYIALIGGLSVWLFSVSTKK